MTSVDQFAHEDVLPGGQQSAPLDARCLLRVTVRAEESQVIQQVVTPVAIDMIDLQRERKPVPLRTQTAHLTRLRDVPSNHRPAQLLARSTPHIGWQDNQDVVRRLTTSSTRTSNEVGPIDTQNLHTMRDPPMVPRRERKVQSTKNIHHVHASRHYRSENFESVLRRVSLETISQRQPVLTKPVADRTRTGEPKLLRHLSNRQPLIDGRLQIFFSHCTNLPCARATTRTRTGDLHFTRVALLPAELWGQSDLGWI